MKRNPFESSSSAADFAARDFVARPNNREKRPLVIGAALNDSLFLKEQGVSADEVQLMREALGTLQRILSRPLGALDDQADGFESPDSQNFNEQQQAEIYQAAVNQFRLTAPAELFKALQKVQVLDREYQQKQLTTNLSSAT